MQTWEKSIFGCWTVRIWACLKATTGWSWVTNSTCHVSQDGSVPIWGNFLIFWPVGVFIIWGTNYIDSKFWTTMLDDMFCRPPVVALRPKHHGCYNITVETDENAHLPSYKVRGPSDRKCLPHLKYVKEVTKMLSPSTSPMSKHIVTFKDVSQVTGQTCSYIFHKYFSQTLPMPIFQT